MKNIEAILGMVVMLVNIYTILTSLNMILKNKSEDEFNKFIRVCIISVFSLKFIRSKNIILKIISIILLSINLKICKNNNISIGE